MVVMVADSRILIDRRKTLLSNMFVFLLPSPLGNFLGFLITFWIGLYILFQDTMFENSVLDLLPVHSQNKNYTAGAPLHKSKFSTDLSKAFDIML